MPFTYPPWRGLDQTEAHKNLRRIRDRLADSNFTPHVHGPSFYDASVESLVVVSTLYGREPSRIEAIRRAHGYLERSVPMPRYILVEGVFEGECPMEWPSFVEHIKVPITEESRYVWLKESLLDIGAGIALTDRDVTGLLFLDSDSAFCDPSWAVWVSDALSQYDMIHPADIFYLVDFPKQERKNSFLVDGWWDKEIETKNTTYFSVGITRGLYGMMGNRLPKNQNRYADADLLSSAEAMSVRYGTAGQALFHMPHKREGTTRALQKYAARAGKPFDAREAIDWEPPVPVWLDTEEARTMRDLLRQEAYT